MRAGRRLVRVLLAIALSLVVVSCNLQPTRIAPPDAASGSATLPSHQLQEPLVVRTLGTDPTTGLPDVARFDSDVFGPDAAKRGPFAKVTFDLALAYRAHEGGVTRSGLVPTFADVLVDATATTSAEGLLADLVALGLTNGVAFGRTVSGTLPVAAIRDAADLDSLLLMRPALAMTEAGSVTSEGVASMVADAARSHFGVDGSGTMVGVLSDSFDRIKDPDCTPHPGQGDPPGSPTSYADDVASGDLPPGVVILDDSATCSGAPGDLIDEGRAMAQLVFDVAPGAGIAFHTAFAGQAAFAQGILDLAAAGADVIVDDVIYFAEPMFQDGVIAQAADAVAAAGVPFFSSAGNRAMRSYESAFRSSGVAGAFGGVLHDFDPDPTVIQTIQLFTLAPGQTFIPALQWDEPFASASPLSAGAQSDVDLYLTFPDGTPIPGFASLADNIGGDPFEIVGLGWSGASPITLGLAISLYSGAEPGLLKYVNFGSLAAPTIPQLDAPSSYGHNNAAGGRGVGAAFWQETPAFGQEPPLLEPFSSVGGVPKLFDVVGNRLAVPEVRMQPAITGPDGISTTFFFSDGIGDGVPNFFGTSAAAPHVAGVAALQLAKNPDLSVAGVYAALEDTTIDMGPAGYDFASGHGLVQAEGALAAYFGIATPSELVGSARGSVNLRLGVTNAVGRADSARYRWSSPDIRDIPRLTLSPEGVLRGTVRESGEYAFTAVVEDRLCLARGDNPCAARKTFELTVP